MRMQALTALSLILFTATAAAGQVPDPEDLEFRDGVAKIPDRATFVKLAHQGNAGRDSYLNGIQFVKFILTGAGGKTPKMYFMNTKTRQAHPMFMRDMGMGGRFGRRGRGGRRGGRPPEPAPGEGRTMRGAISFRPLVKSPDGTAGTYVFDFQPNDSFPVPLLDECRDTLVAKAPFLKGKLVYHPLRGGVAGYEKEKAAFAKAGLPVYLDEVFDRDIIFLPMNTGVSFGRLRAMSLTEQPGLRDIVLYTSLPNELPRVSGMITAVRQTPLSHVNLRAIQDKVPNAWVADVTKRPAVDKLIGKYVRYEVRKDGWDIREATAKEVEAHHAGLRPATTRTPPLDLKMREVLPLARIRFEHSAAFGVKCANVAAMHRLGMKDVHVPSGFGIPFHFYDAFMRHNGLSKRVAALIETAPDQRAAALASLREAIENGTMPDELAAAIAGIRKSFGPRQRIRCRSSTNNEDLPGFSGAGLYESHSHAPGSGPLAKTVQKVYASLWTDRAFEEREFYRIDHTRAAMGVLVHPSFGAERVNGVAVTHDVLYQRDGYNYVNVQIGEDMVTNPNELSIPEELLIPWRRGTTRVMQTSNRSAKGKRVLAAAHQETLKIALEKIHDGFAELYGKKAADPRFAMEVEFKVTSDDKLAIKQARPWIYGPEPAKK